MAVTSPAMKARVNGYRVVNGAVVLFAVSLYGFMRAQTP
jgi:hypothetical protein